MLYIRVIIIILIHFGCYIIASNIIPNVPLYVLTYFVITLYIHNNVYTLILYIYILIKIFTFNHVIKYLIYIDIKSVFYYILIIKNINCVAIKKAI